MASRICETCQRSSPYLASFPGVMDCVDCLSARIAELEAELRQAQRAVKRREDAAREARGRGLQLYEREMRQKVAELSLWQARAEKAERERDEARDLYTETEKRRSADLSRMEQAESERDTLLRAAEAKADEGDDWGNEYAAVVQAKRERDEARAVAEEACTKHNDLLALKQTLTCAFCGHKFPPGTPPTQHKALTEHVHQCEKHPLAATIRELRELLTYEGGMPDFGYELAILGCGSHLMQAYRAWDIKRQDVLATTKGGQA